MCGTAKRLGAAAADPAIMQLFLRQAKRFPALHRTRPHWRTIPLRSKTLKGDSMESGGTMRLPMHLKTVSIALAVVVVSFAVSLKVMDFVAPRATNRPPALAELPPLPPAPRASTVMAPIAVALSAIRDAADRGAPRSFAGKADNPISQILQNADIGWTASRGPIAATGAQDVLSLATPLTWTHGELRSISRDSTTRDLPRCPAAAGQRSTSCARWL
jgi:hypothetical protein